MNLDEACNENDVVTSEQTILHVDTFGRVLDEQRVIDLMFFKNASGLLCYIFHDMYLKFGIKINAMLKGNRGWIL